jgi:ribosome biogenesis GTPase
VVHWRASQHNGVVLWAAGGVYRVLLDSNEQVDASIRGRLKREVRTGDRVVAGDRVFVELHDDRSYAIEAVAERKSELARTAPGRGGHRAKVLVANVDQVITVVAATQPEPNLRMLDRLLVLAEANDLPALIVVNKIDLTDRTAVQDVFANYTKAGYDVLFLSVQQQVGIDELNARVCGRESVVAGPSGVGKSSILNLLEPGSALRTAEISQAVFKGQHTTVAALLLPLTCGGFIVDTPGIREVGMWEINPDALDICFREFREFIGDCKYTTSCTHTHEPDCAVRAAAESGMISTARYESYCVMYQEIVGQPQ